MPALHTESDREDAVWHLPRGASLTLAVGSAEKRLRVTDGRLWLTREGQAADAPPADVWLKTGDGVRLAAGSVLVAEGWPQASFELVVPPGSSLPPRSRLGGWLARLAQRLGA